MRDATAGDLPDLVEYGRRFHQHNMPPWRFDPDAFAALLGGLIASPDGYVAIGDGFIAATKTAHPIDPQWTVASELLWWSESGRGLELLRGFREWAHDASEVQFSCPYDSARVRRYFGRISTPREVVFSEVLSCA